MSLVALLQQPPTGRYDKVEFAYSQLDDDNRAAFKQLIQDDVFSAGQIAGALRDMGHQVNEGQVVYFRKKVREGSVLI